MELKMTRLRLAALLVLSVAGVFPNLALSQPAISGALSGSLGPGDFVVEGNCSITYGETLTIEPGTTFLFSGHYTLNVFGQLNAEGTETDSIRFIRQFPTDECRHGGIRFLSGSSVNSTLRYCLIDNARNDEFPNYFGGGIYCSNIGMQISNCTISNSSADKGGGLYGMNAPLAITDCLFEGNTSTLGGGGIFAFNSAMTVNESTFRENQGLGGGLNATTSPLNVENCLFERNSGGDGGGLYSSDSEILIVGCTFKENQGENGGGILLYNSNDAEVRNCLIYGNSSAST